MALSSTRNLSLIPHPRGRAEPCGRRHVAMPAGRSPGRHGGGVLPAGESGLRDENAGWVYFNALAARSCTDLK
ncbi:hypothetical protein SAMN04489764_1084 [Thermostaphylospora chromogena]|uniref:Uncharacterized protein n=1 Tax=Thermostaphylospora chromogena TaxID=35622 RepID=A0A1H1BRF7_9ACTN|nr:hypothetical protein SAMN04489764_1084 [Thermostaphylospora chromogena]